MRYVIVAGAIWFATAGTATAQLTDRLEIAAVVRSDRVSFEGGQNTRLPVMGVAVGYRVWRNMVIEAEATSASGESRHSHEGDFISYAGPGATREEFLRMAVIARRTTVHKAGPGLGTAVAVDTRHPGRVNLSLRAGVSFRHYDYTEDTTVLRVPEGVTFGQAEAAMPDTGGNRGRSGLLVGAALPIRVAGRLHLAPEVRWVWGGPARIGNNYDEGSVGVRAMWKF